MEKYLYNDKEIDRVPSDFLDAILKSINDLNFHLFLGSGFTRELNGLTWNNYCNELIGTIRYNPIIKGHQNYKNIIDFLDQLSESKYDYKYKFSLIKQLIKCENLDKDPYNISLDDINKRFFCKEHQTSVNIINRNIIMELMKIPSRKITTNYDNLLSVELGLSNLKYEDLSNESLLDNNVKYCNDTIFCIHGFAGNGYNSMIVDQEQYLDRYYYNSNNKKALELLTKNKFSQKDNIKVILFLGYGLTELEILQYFYRDNYEKEKIKKIALLPFENIYFYNIVKNYFNQNFGIEIIGYVSQKGLHSNFYNFIEEMVNELKPKIDKNILISETFEIPNEALEEKEILERIEILKSMAPYYIEKFFSKISNEKYIKMFIKNKIYDDVNDSAFNIYALQCLNENIYSFLKSELCDNFDEIKNIIKNNIKYLNNVKDSISALYVRIICKLLLKTVDIFTKREINLFNSKLLMRELETILVYDEIEVKQNNSFEKTNVLFKNIVKNSDSRYMETKYYKRLIDKFIGYTDVINVLKVSIDEIKAILPEESKFICFESCEDIFRYSSNTKNWIFILKELITDEHIFEKNVKWLYLLENDLIMKTLFFVSLSDEKKYKLVIDLILNREYEDVLAKIIKSTLFEYEIGKLLSNQDDNSYFKTVVEKVFDKNNEDELYDLQKYYKLLDIEEYEKLYSITGYKPTLSPHVKITNIDFNNERDEEIESIFLSSNIKIIFDKYKDIKNDHTKTNVFTKQFLIFLNKNPKTILNNNFWANYPNEIFMVIYNYIENLDETSLKKYSKEEIQLILNEIINFLMKKENACYVTLLDNIFKKMISYINCESYDDICVNLINLITKHELYHIEKFNQFQNSDKDMFMAFINTAYYTCGSLAINLLLKKYEEPKKFPKNIVNMFIDILNNNYNSNITKIFTGYFFFEIEAVDQKWIDDFYISNGDYAFYNGYFSRNIINFNSEICKKVIKDFPKIINDNCISSQAKQILSHQIAYLFLKNKLGFDASLINDSNILGDILYYYQNNNKGNKTRIIEFVNLIINKDNIENDVIERILFMIQKCNFTKKNYKKFLLLVVKSVEKIEVTLRKEYEYDQMLHIAIEIFEKYYNETDFVLMILEDYIKKDVQIDYSKELIINLLKSLKNNAYEDYCGILLKLKKINNSYIFKDLYDDLF